MADILFTQLIKSTKTSDQIGNDKDTNTLDQIQADLIFANITFTLNGKQTTGTYEFFGKFQKKKFKSIRKSIKDVINRSFDAINNGNCYSFYKFLTESHRRYGRILVAPGTKFNECRLSGDSAFDDVDTPQGHIDIIKSEYDIDKAWPQKHGNKIVKIDTILHYYKLYHDAINTTEPVFFYLIRPALDNERLNGMLFFASFKEVGINSMREISYRLSNELTRRVFDNIDRESVKSAVAAIMSRNLSHNLGSHYLYYTKTALEGLSEKGGNFAPNIRGAAKVLSYIQSRMDYLATIISNDKYTYGSVNFKSQIWDELTVDDFSKRHYQESDISSIAINDRKERLLALQNIVTQAGLLIESYNNLPTTSLNSDMFFINDSIQKKIKKRINSIRNNYDIINSSAIFERTTNFLLTNLILSENYTRPDITGSTIQRGKKALYLYVSFWNGKKYDVFTGTNNTDPLNGPTMEDELPVKSLLSRLDLALPGGTMSCHAFFNILENFIRNSAKYSWGKYSRPQDLTFTIALKINPQKHEVVCTIFDNKHDALKKRQGQTLIHVLKSRLQHLTILGEDNTIDKENKGLKEMLFSAVWLKANEFADNLPSIFTTIQRAKIADKLRLIKNYGFEIVSVDDNCFSCKNSQSANLGIRFTLPLFTQTAKLESKKTEDLIKLHTDVIDLSSEENKTSNKIFGRSYEQIFPRRFQPKNTKLDLLRFKKESPIAFDNDDKGAEDTYALYCAIKSNFDDIDNYSLSFAGLSEPGSEREKKQCISYDTHFSTTMSVEKLENDYYGKYAYVDTISGSNFSKTLEGMFKSGITSKHGLKVYSLWSDMYLSLKIKEAALTRITIIDERLFNNVRWQIDGKKEQIVDIRGSAQELSMRNIRVLNFIEDQGDIKKRKSKSGKNLSFLGNKCSSVNGLPFLKGNDFLPTGPYADMPNATNFLSIHLGLIEKLLKSESVNSICGDGGGNPLSEERVEKLMNEIVNTFGVPVPNRKQKRLYICIHSGRGNFSHELEGPLKEFPFITLGALESSFNNSKYLLAQLFYNVIYIGKGEVNKSSMA